MKYIYMQTDYSCQNVLLHIIDAWKNELDNKAQLRALFMTYMYQNALTRVNSFCVILRLMPCKLKTTPDGLYYSSKRLKTLQLLFDNVKYIAYTGT